MASPHCRSLPVHGPAHGRVLLAATVLRTRDHRRGGEGLSSRPEPTFRRRWLAISLATVLVTLCFWFLAFGAAVAGSGETPSGDSEDVAPLAGGFIGLSLLLAPLAFVVGATVSRRQDWPLGVAAAMALAATVGLPLLVFGNPAAALLCGFAAGAVVSLSRPPELDWRYRAVAAGIVSLLAIAGLGNSATFVLIAIIGPALPFTAVGLSDMVQTRHLGVVSA